MGRGSSKVGGGSNSAVSAFGKEAIGDNDVRITRTLDENTGIGNQARVAGLGNKWGTFEIIANQNHQDVIRRASGILYKYGGRVYGITGNLKTNMWHITDIRSGMAVSFPTDGLFRAKDAIRLASDNIHSASKTGIKSAEDRFRKAKKKR